MDTREYLEPFYGGYDEDARLGSRHGRVEYLTTMRYIEKYLEPGMRILEVGAATGRYSHALAGMGYAVDAVELLERNIEVFRANTAPGAPVTIAQGDARDLSAFASDTYDITLLLGPMYHLFTREDKMKALSEAVRVTRPGGVVFAAYCIADASMVQQGFVKGELGFLIENGLLDPETFQTISRAWGIFELHRKEQIDDLRAELPVEQLHFVATDGYAHHMRQALEEMDEELYDHYLRYHFATCERQDLIGYSNHTLDIFRKEGSQC